MIISVLTAYDDNDKYSDLDTESAAIDEESGTDTIPDDSNISKLSKSRMKNILRKLQRSLKILKMLLMKVIMKIEKPVVSFLVVD